MKNAKRIYEINGVEIPEADLESDTLVDVCDYIVGNEGTWGVFIYLGEFLYADAPPPISFFGAALYYIHTINESSS